MAIIAKTSDPAGLLARIKKAIAEKHIETWEVDSDGDFTHKPEQFVLTAWLRPAVLDGELRFYIVGSKKIKGTRAIYAIYHGRFIEMLLAHFFKSFDVVWPSRDPMEDDSYTFET